MQRFKHLDRLLDHIWGYMADGVAHGPGRHPFATPTVGTRGPDLRTVTLRHVDRSVRRLTFHSDARATKISEIRRDPAVAWHCWDPERQQHLVLQGRAAVHTSDEVAEHWWKQEPPQALRRYARTQAPGTSLGAPADYDEGPSSEAEDADDGPAHFAVVRTTVERIDWLHTHPDGHYRAHFQWNGKLFRSTWVVP